MDEGSSSSSTTVSTVATTPTTAGSPTMVTGVGSLVNAIARAVQSGMSASMEELGRTLLNQTASPESDSGGIFTISPRRLEPPLLTSSL